MSEIVRELFDSLQSADRIRGLIGRSEDLHLDCKEWPADNEAQKMLAKAACALTNAEGGVLLLGMSARSISKDEPDVIESAAPVSDTAAVKSRALDLIGQLIEPGIEGAQALEINEASGSKSGFVVIFIPPSQGPPRRSRKDWKFYQRIGSGSYPMEYFQIQERFGRRPPPKLELYLEQDGVKGLVHSPREPARWFVLGLRNAGSGIAKFPSVRYARASGLVVNTYGIDGSYGFGLPQRPSESEWIVFRGGTDDVIYPDEVRKITKLYQTGTSKGPDGLPLPKSFGPAMQPQTPWVFKGVDFRCEISCADTPTVKIEKPIPEESCSWLGS
jgi:hypothetical protein